MKNYLLLVLFASLFIYGCGEEETPEPSCANPWFSISQSNMGSPQNGGAFTLHVSNNYVYSFYEMEYGSNGFARGNGTTQAVNNQSSVDGLANGAYDVYLRGNCGGTEWSNWEGPISILITGVGGGSLCPMPTNLNVTNSSYKYQLRWDFPSSSTADLYQIEHGAQGFAQGSGTTLTTSYTSYSGGLFAQGNTYAYYVRAQCEAGEWSNWAGPKSFYADNNANMCLPPTNLQAVRQNGGVRVNFSPNGEDEHQVSFNNANWLDPTDVVHDIPLQGAFFTGFYTIVTYYAFFRAQCDNGNFTAWVGPVVIN